VDFADPADWGKTFDQNRRVLISFLGKYAPTTGVNVKNGGKYYVWTYTIDFAISPRTRLYNVLINGERLEKPAGGHGFVGWRWEKLGCAQMNAGLNIVSLKPITSSLRSESILFTQDPDFDPNISVADDAARKPYKRAQEKLEFVLETDWDANPPAMLEALPSAKSVEIGNAALRISYAQKKSPSGKIFYERAAAVNSNGKWLKLPSYGGEYLFLQSGAENPEYDENFYWVSWNKPHARPQLVIDGVYKEIDTICLNPYGAGKTDVLRPVKVEKQGALALNLTFEDGTLAVLSLHKTLPIAKFTAQKKVQKDGYYSFGFIGFNEFDKSSFDRLLLPTLYQNRRTMETPKMVSNNFVSQPLALVSEDVGGVKVASALVADPKLLPFGEWSCGGGGVYGFSIANYKNGLQPAIFRPIFGGRDSQKKAGETLETSFYIITLAGDWKSALELADNDIFAGGAFREAYGTSFSDAIANIAAYLKNAEASAWSDVYKARTQVESKNTGTQSSPLAEIEAALLTDDEETYKNFALPTIEYSLSRKFCHFSPDEKGGLYNIKLDASGDFYASLNALLGGLNPWLKDFYIDENGAPMPYGKAYPHWLKSVIPDWSVLLGIYLADKDPAVLGAARAACDKWLEEYARTRNTAEPILGEFINFSLYPYWWYLPDMYEITGDKKYIDAAKEGAFYSLSSLWSFPMPPEGEVEIHKNDLAEGIYNFWWRGNEHFRLGRDENAKKLAAVFDEMKRAGQPLPLHKELYVLPQKKADAMKVSRIGLSIEQHSTFLSRATNFRNIDMPSWSPEMLKVAQYTGDDILMKFSRHSIIGRYANFLGYYVLDYTDVMHDPEYPYKGPDVTTFYYHHAPCHFAQSVDYLMAQIEAASANKIKFPHVRQQGYVWFTDRIFGLAGNVFDNENCRPLLNKGAVKTSSPKVSVLLARGDASLWIIVLNDANSATSFEISLDASAAVFKGADIAKAAILYDAAGKAAEGALDLSKPAKLDMAARSLIALKLEAAPAQKLGCGLKPLGKDARVTVKNAAAGFNDLCAYRIRGPFGKDSIFAFFTDGFTKKGAKVTFKLVSNGEAKTFEDAEYPFEFSVYPLKPDAAATLLIAIKESDGKETTLAPITFKGTL